MKFNLNESLDDEIELEYDDLTFTKSGNQRGVDDWDEIEYTTSWTYDVDKDDLYTYIFEECIDIEDFPDAFEDEFNPNDEADWNRFTTWLDANYDKIFAKYKNKILSNYEEKAAEDAAEKYDDYEYYIDPDWSPGSHHDIDLDEAVEEKVCCICKQVFNGYGNNAEPVCSGTCCDKCNMEKVIPMRFKMMKDNNLKKSEELNEGNPVSGKIPESIDSFLQDIAQMYQTIDYGDIMDHDYSEEDLKKLRSLRRKFREEAQYEGDEEAEAAMNDIAEKVAIILKAKNESKELNEAEEDPNQISIFDNDHNHPVTLEVTYNEYSMDNLGQQHTVKINGNNLKDALLNVIDQLGFTLDTERMQDLQVKDILARLKAVNGNNCDKITTIKNIDDELMIFDATLTEAADNNYKITYYLSTANAERRPETREDIDNDYKVSNLQVTDDLEAMKEAFRIQRAIDESDVDFEMEDYNIRSIDDFIRYFNEDTDWGDGSTIILKVEGPDGVIYDSGYDKQTFINNFNQREAEMKDLIAEMEKYDPDAAEQWKKTFGFTEDFDPECLEDDYDEGLLLGDINVALDASGQSVGILGGSGGETLNASYDSEIDDMDEAIGPLGAGLIGAGVGFLGSKLFDSNSGDPIAKDEDLDDSYDYGDIEEKLCEDAEISRIRHIYGVE